MQVNFLHCFFKQIWTNLQEEFEQHVPLIFQQNPICFTSTRIMLVSSYYAKLKLRSI